MTEPRAPSTEERQTKARWDYHDPTAGFAGAPPALSALTLRLVLATFGLILCVAGTVVFATVVRSGGGVAVFGVLTVVTVIDIVVIIRRKARGEPG